LNLTNIVVVGKRFETSNFNCDIISCRALSTFDNDWLRAKPALKKTGFFCDFKKL
jgi:16S rRNA (guanine527-N7)-methyltransferase